MNEDIKLEYIHLCDYATPALNGKVNLIGIFDWFVSEKMFDFFVAFKINVKLNASYKISVEIISSKDNKIILPDTNPITVPANAPGLNYNILKQMKGVTFQVPGEYKVIILVNDLPIYSKLFEVKKIETKVV